MSPEAMLSLTSAALGAGGAILAQAVAEFFSARRDRRRLEWEKTQRAEDVRLTQTARFEQSKLDAYRRYLNLLYPSISTLQHMVEYPDEPVPSRLRRYDQPFREEVESLRWEVSLLGDHRVTSAVEASHALLLVALIQFVSPDDWPHEKRVRTAKDALRAWQHTSHVMRADLKGDQESLAALHKRWQDQDRDKLSGDFNVAEARLDELYRRSRTAQPPVAEPKVAEE
ncbi:hypothetical protein APR04_002586 [Promicromonospora umidemergens]|uniref:Uncharacterized protein n=1 Tax=Promicromonospora umidemergens TaxID=629679 RepID=A0ABP8WVI3_9MICO|nr:hypothetical protein [Promicromonospora umidemergens]MCP2283678.1 hypothetical protein [Promicromonospora umidemergens]